MFNEWIFNDNRLYLVSFAEFIIEHIYLYSFSFTFSIFLENYPPLTQSQHRKDRFKKVVSTRPIQHLFSRIENISIFKLTFTNVTLHHKRKENKDGIANWASTQGPAAGS